MDIQYYLELQRRIIDIFRYVACHKDNFDTYSLMLESLLVDTCSFFDSTCQTFIREKAAAGHSFKEEQRITDFASKLTMGNNFKFPDYRALLEGDFALSKKLVNLNLYEGALFANPLTGGYVPDDISGCLLRPFEQWSTFLDARPLPSPWWKAFTDLKHDRLTHFPQAKLENCIHALAAVFVLLTVRNEAKFKQGNVPPNVYELFFPKYWQWGGRTTICGFVWK